MTNPVSECEVRTLTHLTRVLSYPGGMDPLIISDVDADPVLDANLIALGGPGSNYKTADILGSSANLFVNMTHTGLSVPSGEALPSACNQHKDY
jgi:hypothetical protein